MLWTVITRVADMMGNSVVNYFHSILVSETLGEVLFANATVYAVKSQGFCATLLQSEDVTSLLSTGSHSRSRFTDQNVYRLIPTLSAKLSTVWKSLW